jgi:hypothetical protein
LALGSFLGGLDLPLHGYHVDTRELLDGQEFEEGLDEMGAAMEAIHRKDSSEVPCRQRIRETVPLRILRSREWSLIGLKWIESAACASPLGFINARPRVSFSYCAIAIRGWVRRALRHGFFGPYASQFTVTPYKTP